MKWDHRYRYFAIKPIKLDPKYTRIEKARTPTEAFNKAFGRGFSHGFCWKDLGTQVRPIQTDKWRIAQLCDPKGWINFPDPLGIHKRDMEEQERENEKKEQKA
jgi:hypothetical protein